MSARAFLVGTIANDVSIQIVNKVELVEFSLLCKDGRGIEYIKCVAWGELAILLNKYCIKGSKIEVVGRIKTKEFEIKGKGMKVKNTHVLVDKIEFISNTIKQEDLFSIGGENV